MNKLIIILTLIIITSLSFFYFNKNDDRKLCECVSFGEKVNDLSASFFNRPYSDLGKDSLDLMISIRDSICAPFLQMSSEDLYNLAENCSELKIKTN